MHSTAITAEEAAARSQRRALAEWDLYRVEETATPGLFRVTRNGASYLTSATSCTCPDCQLRGNRNCKHIARVKAKLGARSRYAVDDAAEKRAQAARDRANLWD